MSDKPTWVVTERSKVKVAKKEVDGLLVQKKISVDHLDPWQQFQKVSDSNLTDPKIFFEQKIEQAGDILEKYGMPRYTYNPTFNQEFACLEAERFDDVVIAKNIQVEALIALKHIGNGYLNESVIATIRVCKELELLNGKRLETNFTRGLHVTNANPKRRTQAEKNKWRETALKFAKQYDGRPKKTEIYQHVVAVHQVPLSTVKKELKDFIDTEILKK